MRAFHRAGLFECLFLIAFLVLLNSCAQRRSVKTPLFEDRRTGITLREWVDRENVPVAMGYDHPTDVRTDDLKYLLGSIRYQEKGLFGWSETRNVFTADELYRMTPHLVEAFTQADGGKEVLFYLRSGKPGSLFYFERFTDGTMFLAGGKVNVVFGNVNVRAESESSNLFEGDPRRYYGGGLWKLIATGWQNLAEDEGGVHYNWIQLDIAPALAEKQRVEKILTERKRRRMAPLPKKERQLREPESWEDWGEDEQISEEPYPDVYFPDELPAR
ncbi:MAG: hypothetical protein C4520_11135 [Candidatus Abyssobacteria bacterium SURF_5]|uniref:Uncharacterized protein n=1 Tax=Abyssobacteria bacterium (strain SURF_5) TaxID=2093360 RepID=A0A3A4NNV4_ABYX5|nr:MAG: hypothetical protein C4520_11135 [Candidatus Abyssubacteria bacterium SURF_5]